jgi:hypothetical protein
MDINGMTLAQAINTLLRLQNWLNEAVSDRVDFEQAHAQDGGHDVGGHVAHLMRERMFRDAIIAGIKNISEKYDTQPVEVTE